MKNAQGTRVVIVVATHNVHKLRELRAGVGTLPIRWVPLTQQGTPPRIREDGTTLEANAVLKALAVARWSGHVALADDTGLEVQALDGAPGIHSARYAGPAADPAANIRKLLQHLRHIPPSRRRARFRCVLSLAGPQGVLAVVQDHVDGIITTRPLGTHGFGYDAVFAPQGWPTFAQMTLAQKNAISHRGKALRRLHNVLSRFLSISPLPQE